MKKLSLLLSMLFIFTFLTACSDVSSKNEVVTEQNTILGDATIKKEKIVVEDKIEEKETDKEVLEQQATENIQPDKKQEPIQELEIEEKIAAEEELIIQEEYVEEETNSENIIKTLIASGETNFNPNQIERSSNIRLAASYINGLLLQPGDEFSFNKVVGRRTKERGFLPADVFVGGTVAKGYGGGVCQTSSTVCAAVRNTQMKILEQNPHSKRVSYTTIENEAMINYGTSDFRFVNTYDKPIFIEISFERSGDREIIKCDIYLLE